MALLVVNCNITPEYFLNEMSYKEADFFINQYYNNYKNTWEQFRFIGYINAVTAGNKLKKPSDLLLFSWEKEEQEQKENNYSDIDDSVIKQMFDNYLKRI